MQALGKNTLRDEELEEEAYINKTNNDNVIKLKYKTDYDKSSISRNCSQRGWGKSHTDTDWNIYWATPWTVKNFFNGHHRLNDM